MPRINQQLGFTRYEADEYYKQALEARPSYTAGGDTQVVVNDDDFRPAERASTIDERVLPTPTLVIVSQLVGGGLSDVDIGATRQVLSADLAHAPSPEARKLSARAPAPRKAPSLSKLGRDSMSMRV